jgi:hypothetical protein
MFKVKHIGVCDVVQPMYVLTCGTSTVNLANLVFVGASNAKILAFDCAHKEIFYYVLMFGLCTFFYQSRISEISVLA